jgi:hypothetical protein
MGLTTDNDHVVLSKATILSQNLAMNDTEKKTAWGWVVEVEELSSAWCQVRLDDGRLITAIDPNLAGSRGKALILRGDRVQLLVSEGYCMIEKNENLADRLRAGGESVSDRTIIP